MGRISGRLSGRIRNRLLLGIAALSLLGGGSSAFAATLTDIPVQTIKPIDPIIRIDPNLLTLPTQNAGNMTRKWALTIAGKDSFSLLVGPPSAGSDGTSYVGINVAFLVAVGGIFAVTDNGQKLWNIAFTQELLYSPLVGPDGTVYASVGTSSYSDGELIALNKDGTEKWRAGIGYIESSPVIGPDGTVFAAVRGGTIYALDPKNGKEKWTANGVLGSEASLAVGQDGSIYSTSPSAESLTALKPNGSLKWSYKTGGKLSTAPVLGGDGTIYAGASDKRLYAIRPNGTLRWSADLGAVPSAPVAGSDGTVYVGADRKMFALQGDGAVKWKSSFPTEVTSPSLGAAGTVHFLTYNGMVQALNQADGSLQWRFRIPMDEYSRYAPIVKPNGSVLALSSENLKLTLHSLQVDVTDIALDHAALALQTGRSAVFTAVLTPGNASNPGMYWTSSNPAIATIEANGRVTGISAGKATITVRSADNPNESAVAEVTVSDSPGAIAVDGIAVSPAELSVEVGRSKPLAVKISPADATNRAVTWSSGAPGIAQVSNSGQVTGVAEGSAVLTATAMDGGYFATVKVTVLQAKTASAFTDIDDHWAKDDILNAYEIKVVNGYPDFSFRPDGSVTRAEFAVMLMNGLKPAQSGTALPFQDADSVGVWARASVAQAVKLGIISGYTDGTFRPNSNITHAEMAAMVFKASGLALAADTATSYSDDASLPKWARGAISAAEKNGIIVVGGLDSKTFRPLSLTTRAEAAASIVRLLAFLNK